MGMPTEPVLDVMRRTMANLDFIERHASGDGPFEVAQLINSFIGALAHPWEATRADLSALSLSEAKELGWPSIKKERSSDIDPNSLGELVAAIRHSVAHGNIEFLSSGRGEITALRIWNIHPRSRTRTWGAILTVADMRRVLACFVDLIQERHRGFGWYTPRSA
jgi:hypothetical protein